MIQIDHIFHCSECDAKVKREWEYRFGEEAPRPSLPADWFVFDGRIFCGQHLVIATLDKAKPGGLAGVVWREKKL
jgi:hypothetical protein